MKTPKDLKNNDTIGYSSLSDGITKEKKIKDLDESIEMLNNFNIIEDKYTRSSEKGESADSLLRSRELIKLINNKDVSAIISVTGGNFSNEILDYLDEVDFKNNIKWVQGQSDTTILLYYLTTKYDIKTIYSYNASTLPKITLKELTNNLEILYGNKIKQYDILNGWDSKYKIDEEGILIGGCLECLLDLIGTKYDYTNDFIKKYDDKKIIWYFDIDYMTNESLRRSLWHLKNAGWFKNTKLIIFGRNDDEKSFVDLDQEEAINRGLLNTGIKYIRNFDLGHTLPRITLVNGSTVRVKCGDENSIEILD